MSARGVGGIWVVVPFKGPVGSKRRLAGLLNEAERARLSVAMLDGVLDAVLASGQVARLLVMAPEHVSPPGRHDPRLEFVSETLLDRVSEADNPAVDGLNRAVTQAQAAARTAGASSLLILPSDLPLIGAEDVDALVAAVEAAPVVISPDRAAEGTNALLVSPPNAIPSNFGVGSFERHQRLSEEAGLRVSVVSRWGLALDLDTPADVLRLLAIDQECRAARLLHDLEIRSRFASLGLGQPAPSGA